MTIGTSLGAFYEDEYHYQAREFLKKNRPNENREIDPKNDRTKGDENIIDPGTKTEDFITQVSDKEIFNPNMDEQLGIIGGSSGGGVSQFRRSANENIKDLNNPNLTRVEQLARKLGEGENGKGSWDWIGGGGQEHYLRDARRFLRNDKREDPAAYNPKEPNMIGSKEMDARVDATWKAFGDAQKKSLAIEELLKKKDFSEFDAARVKKMQKEHIDLMQQHEDLLNND